MPLFDLADDATFTIQAAVENLRSADRTEQTVEAAWRIAAKLEGIAKRCAGQPVKTDIAQIRGRQAVRQSVAKIGALSYADGVQCMLDCDEALAELTRLSNEVSDLNGLIVAYRKWASECPILETKAGVR
jgi:hypothetical protein